MAHRASVQPEPVMSGYLRKEGAIIHSIRSRFFQLWTHPPFFQYFTKKGGAHIRTVRLIGPNNQAGVGTSANSFHVTTPTRKWKFIASSAAEMSDWKRHFSTACEVAKQNAQEAKNPTALTPECPQVMVAGCHVVEGCATVESLLKDYPKCKVRAGILPETRLGKIQQSGDAEVDTVIMRPNNRASMDECFAGVDVAVLITPTSNTVETMLSYIAASKRASVKFLIILFSATCGRRGIFGSMYNQILTEVREIGVPACYIRSAPPMESLFHDIKSMQEEGKFYSFLKPSVELPWISSYDVGSAIAQVCAEPAPHRDREYTVTGSELISLEELLQRISKMLGKSIVYERLERAKALENFQTSYGLSLLAAEGTLELIDELNNPDSIPPITTNHVATITGNTPTTVEEFLPALIQVAQSS